MQEIGSQEGGAKDCWLGKLAWRKSDKELFFSPKRDLEAAFNKRSDFREALFEGSGMWVFSKRGKFVKNDTPQLRGRRGHVSLMTECMSFGLVSCSVIVF